MSGMPSVAEEQRIALAGRIGGWERAGVISPAERAALVEWAATPWRVYKLPLRIGLFALTWFAASSVAGLFFLALEEMGAIVIGVTAIALAEWLIRGKRFFRTGVEEGLWIIGVFMILFQLSLFGLDDPEPVIAIAAVAILLAGVRLLNVPIALLGVAVAVIWLGVATEAILPAAIALGVTGAVAAALHLRPIERPFWSGLTGWTAALAPPLVWAILLFDHKSAAVIWVAIATVAWLAAGIAFRSRALLAGGWLSLFALGYDLSERTRLLPEAKLVIGGGLLFLAAVALEKWLRTPRRGFTSIPLDDESLEGALQLAGVAAIAPGPLPEGREGGGRFGGAGASGEY
jgi:hypothetical protein